MLLDVPLCLSSTGEWCVLEYGPCLNEDDPEAIDRCIAICTVCGQQWDAVTDLMGTRYAAHTVSTAVKSGPGLN